MKIFDTKDIREIDAYTIKNEPIASIDLMERAAGGCAKWIAESLSKSTSIVIFTGPGNNGGDGWAIARLLTDQGFHHIQLYHLQISRIISQDAEVNRGRLLKQGKVPVKNIESDNDFPSLRPEDVVVDALFGSGLTRSLEGLSLNLVKLINQSECRIISIDVPSGLFGEDNTGNPDQGIINASDTLTFQFPKRSFFFGENEKHTGKWHIIPIGLHKGILSEKETRCFYVIAEMIAGKLKKRSAFSHKGLYGHGLLIAGSYGMFGAAMLAARACLRTGIGLLTTHIPRLGYPIVQGSVPESLFSIDSEDNCIAHIPDTDKFSAIGIGPGLGTSEKSVTALELLLKSCHKPLLLDADALNILSANPHLLKLVAENTIITPHPGEFERLAGKSVNGYRRNKLQIEFSEKYKVIIILKGAYSSITLPDGRCYYNSTGNPGMSTAGTGDVLTGMVLSLLAQRYPPEEAALLGTFLHGFAGDLASAAVSEQALIASDVIENIGSAYRKIMHHEKIVD